MTHVALFIPEDTSFIAFHDALCQPALAPTFRADRFYRTWGCTADGKKGESYFVNARDPQAAATIVRAYTKTPQAVVLSAASVKEMANALNENTVMGFLVAEPSCTAKRLPVTNLLNDATQDEALKTFFTREFALSSKKDKPFSLTRDLVGNTKPRTDNIRVYHFG